MRSLPVRNQLLIPHKQVCNRSWNMLSARAIPSAWRSGCLQTHLERRLILGRGGCLVEGGDH